MLLPHSDLYIAEEQEILSHYSTLSGVSLFHSYIRTHAMMQVSLSLSLSPADNRLGDNSSRCDAGAQTADASLPGE